MDGSSAPNTEVRIGPYRLVEEVGVGGLGKVFRAIDDRNGKIVAVKVLHDRYAMDKKFLGIFHRELLIISRLHHKHIVRHVDSGFEPPRCFIVTEFVDGFSLHRFIKRARKVPPLVAMCIVIDMLKGIDYLHLHDTIHSDLSAANVLLSTSGRVLVTDFGLACQLDVEDYKNYMVGTPGYYSPEHLMEAPIVTQTDIYCSGLILYELASGTKAVPAISDRKKILEFMKVIPLGQVQASDKNLQAGIRKILKMTLQFNVTKRIQTVDALMFECYRLLKAYNIRFARHAIHQYLCDTGLSPGPFKGEKQDIYVGFINS